jgi:hypothetical protein
LETSTPIKTPIVRESQVGRLLRIFWFAFGFMMAAFVSPNGAGGGAGRRVFLNKGVRFSGKVGLKISSSFRGV